MTVLLVVMRHKARKPFLSLLKALEAVRRVQIVAAVFERPEERLRVWVVVTHARTAMGELNAAILQERLRTGGLH